MKLILLLSFALGCCTRGESLPNGMALGSMPFLELENGSSTQSPASNQTEEEKNLEMNRLWIRFFFEIIRDPSNATVTLIFPGFFGSDSGQSAPVRRLSPVRDRTNRHFSGHSTPKKRNTTVPTYSIEGQSNGETVEIRGQLSSVDYSIHSSKFTISNNTFWYDENIDGYIFRDLEAEEEVQRQQRRLAAARQHLSLLNVNEQHISTMINSVFSFQRDFLANVTVRNSVIRYITTKMRSFGLVTGNQLFYPKEYSEYYGEFVPNGTNIIGILPGELWGTKEDEILVIGAHWDTVPNSNGMDDNGSGVTALLEVARALTEGSCHTKYSIIFVAFDLEEIGCLGSIYFIRDFLIPHVLVAHGGARLKGAFILDTIMNFNETESSQTLSPQWGNVVPDLPISLQAENYTGNFLAALYRKDVDSTLASTLAYHWNEEYFHSKGKAPSTSTGTSKNPSATENVVTIPSPERFNLKNIPMDLQAELDDLEQLIPWMDLLRSDHARFWYHNLGYPESFPAILITDTGPYRGMMKYCYHQPCDSSLANQESKFASVKFLAKTSEALINTMVNLSQAQCLIHKLRNVPLHMGHGGMSMVKPTTVPAVVGTLITILQWIGISL